MKTRTQSILPLLTFLYLSPLATSMQAISPPPDGGYPGGNTAEGQNALLSLTVGAYNTAVGVSSLRTDGTGSYNTAVGAGALFGNTETQNTALGAAAGLSLTTGSRNICIGSGVIGVAGENNTIRIGDNLPTDTGQSACYIGGIYGQLYGVNGTQCYVDPNGKLSVFFSARRFKTDIADIGAVSEALLALRPVTFHYKPELDKTGTRQFGLVAEEVATVNPDLVTHDAKGALATVRYEAVNAMLLNEFLKQHKKVQKLEATVVQQQENFQCELAEQRKQIEALTAGLQNVSAQLELSKTATQTVLNNY
jgi:hypothetical protein